MKKIRILNFNHLGWKTWSARLIDTLMSWLPADRFDFHNLVGYGFLPQSNTTSLYRTYPNWFYRNIRYKVAVWCNFFFDWMTPGSIDMSYLRTSEPYIEADIIHLHCVQWWYFDWDILPEISKEKKIIMTLHDDWIISGNDSENLFHPYKTHAQYLKRKAIFEKCNITYIWVSDWVTLKVGRDPIIGNNTIKTIYNWIDATVFFPQDKILCREQLWFPIDKKIIISIAGSGGKSNAKWLQYVNRIIKKYRDNPDYLFITLWNYKDKSIAGNLIEMWYLPREMVAKYLNAADIFLYPTLMDSFGLIIAESLACGCPVVTFQTWGSAEIVTHYANGYVAKHKDYDDLFAWFNWCIQMDRGHEITLDKKFHKENMVQQYSQEYIDMLED